MKNSDLFYEARDAVESGTYLKAKKRHLQKYLEELNIVQPWESDQTCWHAVHRKHEWLEKIKTELQKRKDSHQACIRSIAKGLLIYVVLPLLVLIIGFFLLRYFQDKQNTIQSPPQKQAKDSNEPFPSASPSTSKIHQQQKKAK